MSCLERDMSGNTDRRQIAEPSRKARKRLSGDDNAREASDARAETVRRILKRNRDSGE
jgi:hypothetical protein